MGTMNTPTLINLTPIQENQTLLKEGGNLAVSTGWGLLGVTFWITIGIMPDLGSGAQAFFMVSDAALYTLSGCYSDFYGYTGVDCLKAAMYLFSMACHTVFVPFIPAFLNLTFWGSIWVVLSVVSTARLFNFPNYNKYKLIPQVILPTDVVHIAQQLPTNPKHRYALLAQAAGCPSREPRGFGSHVRQQSACTPVKR